jgi:hypothetical protein
MSSHSLRHVTILAMEQVDSLVSRVSSKNLRCAPTETLEGPCGTAQRAKDGMPTK